MVCALLYLICGASREDIICNYRISYEYLKDFLAPLFKRIPKELHHAFRSDEENMKIFLDYLDRKWDGNAAKLLIANGLTVSEIEALKSKCIGD